MVSYDDAESQRESFCHFPQTIAARRLGPKQIYPTMIMLYSAVPHLGYGVSRLWTYKKDEFNNIIVCDSPRDDGCARASRTNRYRDWAGYVTTCCTSAPKEASLHCSHSFIQSFAELTA